MSMDAAAAGIVPKVTMHWRLRMSLEQAEMNQQDMAEALGVDVRTVNRWCLGHYQPRRGMLVAWALRTGVPLQWLETGQAPTESGPDNDLRARRDSNPQPSGLESRRLLVWRLAA